MARDYEAALAQLGRALVFGIHPSLEGIRELTDELGRPQDSYASIQVAGTNGKTSTARMTEAILRAHGFKTGLYTSPHLESYTERIEIDGAPVSDQEFANGVFTALEAAESRRPGKVKSREGYTEFEILTAAALWLYRQRNVEFAVLEVGLGGRWDATSVVGSSVAVITGIGLDHTHILGDTLEKIAAEKAGIIKRGSTVVLGPGTHEVDEVFLERAEALDTYAVVVREGERTSPVSGDLTVSYEVRSHPSEVGGETVVDVRGRHGAYDALALAAPGYQAANVATAVAAAEAALGRPLDANAVRHALRELSLPGRFEIARRDPLVIIDGSHNPQAAAVLAAAIDEEFGEDRRPRALLGVLSDKDARGIVSALASAVSRFVVTQPDSSRALPAHELAAIVEEQCGYQPQQYESVKESLAHLLREQGPLLVTGSLTTAGEARSILGNGWETQAD